ncbi:ATP-binding protein [Pseudolysinimonas kribbensis]|uniref:ATP-binding protein n=1 Tax=Pseudolysinimonas kribbensis TaxID=433641 RepID=UPI0031E12BEA
MRIRLLGGFAVEHDGKPLDVVGERQRGLLFRLAIDAGSQVGYRALAEDLWPDDPPENARAALQSLVSRLRGQLPAGVLASGPGGYRLAIDRADVDAVRFQDLVAAASAAPAPEAPALASAALGLWCGEPWTPGDGYDWFQRDLATDRATALRLGGTPSPAEPDAGEPGPAAIPAALTAFVGRDEELAGVTGQLERGRLVTILGPGGAGKTRLAMESARAHRHPIVVELAPAGPDELWQAILGAIGRELRSMNESAAASTPAERVIAALAGRDVLLVLDNCEHLIQVAALAAHELLQALPRLHVLTTSREPLGVPGEAFVPLGPLDPLAAQTLFDDRVLAARGRAIDQDEQDAATRIRERLDGLPLALELAAAKARTMTIGEIADGLDDRFGLLSGGLRTVLPRHQTLRALVDWSWSLLGPGERRMLVALAIYPAGVAVADAAGVAAAHGGTRAELDVLVDKSLLQRTGGRYRALETIREYGIEKLAGSGELTRERIAQARRLAQATAVHDAELRSAAIHDAIAWFDAEDDNLAAALRFCAEASPSDLVRLTGGCLWYWIVRDRNDDAIQWIAAAGPYADEADDDWQGVFVRAAAMMMRTFSRGRRPEIDQGELARLSDAAARTDHDIVLAIPVLVRAFADTPEGDVWMRNIRIPDPEGLPLTPWGRAVLTVARAAMSQNGGDLAELGASSGRAVELFESTGDRWGMALAQQMRAEWLALEGRFEEALAMSDASTAAMTEITSSWDLLQQQGLAVNLLIRLGRVDEAQARADRMLAVARDSDSARSVALACAIACFLAIELEDIERARALVAELDESLAEWDDVPPQLHAMAGMARGGVASLDGDTASAERELRVAAEAAVESNDYPIMAATAVGVASLAARTGRFDEAHLALDLATVLRGAPDPHNPLEVRVRAQIAAHATTARPPRERAVVDRDTAASELAQILRR